MPSARPESTICYVPVDCDCGPNDCSCKCYSGPTTYDVDSVGASFGHARMKSNMIMSTSPDAKGPTPQPAEEPAAEPTEEPTPPPTEEPAVPPPAEDPG